MSDWIGNIISALALGVSGLSLYVSGWSLHVSRHTAQRAIDAEKVTAWIELQATGSSEWLLATLSVKNPSRNDIKIQKISIGIPDFRLADLEDASVDDGKGNRVLPKNIEVKNHSIGMPLSKHGNVAVPSGETIQAKFLIYQPAHSQKRKTKVNVMYWTMEPVQQWRILPVTVQTRSDL